MVRFASFLRRESSTETNTDLHPQKKNNESYTTKDNANPEDQDYDCSVQSKILIVPKISPSRSRSAMKSNRGSSRNQLKNLKVQFHTEPNSAKMKNFIKKTNKARWKNQKMHNLLDDDDDDFLNLADDFYMECETAVEDVMVNGCAEIPDFIESFAHAFVALDDTDACVTCDGNDFFAPQANDNTGESNNKLVCLQLQPAAFAAERSSSSISTLVTANAAKGTCTIDGDDSTSPTLQFSFDDTITLNFDGSTDDILVISPPEEIQYSSEKTNNSLDDNGRTPNITKSINADDTSQKEEGEGIQNLIEHEEEAHCVTTWFERHKLNFQQRRKQRHLRQQQLLSQQQEQSRFQIRISHEVTRSSSASKKKNKKRFFITRNHSCFNKQRQHQYQQQQDLSNTNSGSDIRNSFRAVDKSNCGGWIETINNSIRGRVGESQYQILSDGCEGIPELVVAMSEGLMEFDGDYSPRSPNEDNANKGYLPPPQPRADVVEMILNDDASYDETKGEVRAKKCSPKKQKSIKKNLTATVSSFRPTPYTFLDTVGREVDSRDVIPLLQQTDVDEQVCVPSSPLPTTRTFGKDFEEGSEMIALTSSDRVCRNASAVTNIEVVPFLPIVDSFDKNTGDDEKLSTNKKMKNSFWKVKRHRSLP